MAVELDLIVELVTVLGAATVGGHVANRLGQPVLLGYLLAGTSVGPTGLGLVSATGDTQVLAEIGVALLLFVLGIEFSLKELMRLRTIALGGSPAQILLTILLGGGLTYLTGWVDSIPKAIFLGAVLSLSSTAVVLKSLIERNEVHTIHGQIMLAILVVQDLGLGVMLAVLPALAEPPETIGIALGIALLKAVLFLGGAFLAGRWVMPWLIRWMALSGSQELFLLGVLVLCLGIALLAASLGLGIAMGAFVAGLMIANVEHADHALDRILPMRDVFSTLFFASIGLLIDPRFLWENLFTLLGLVGISMVGKAAIAAAVVRFCGFPLKTSLTVGLGINQIGEFSFVLAGVAQDENLFSDRLYDLVVGTTAVTLLITPFLLRSVPYWLNWLEQWPIFDALLHNHHALEFSRMEEGMTGHIVVAGYGRVGQTLVRMIYFQGYPLLVIDNSEASLQALRERKIPYLFGDASSQLVLEKANLAQARAMAITLPDPMATRLTLKRALSLAPDLDITVRAHVGSEIDSLYQLGAQEVVQPEFEAALEMGAHLLLNLGDSTFDVQQMVHRYRSGRYRDIQPERSQYWGAANFEAEMEGLQRNWYTVHDDSPLRGLNLAQAQVRQVTGATVMAIERNKRLHRYPTGEASIEVGDRLLVVGNDQEHNAFNLLLEGRSA